MKAKDSDGEYGSPAARTPAQRLRPQQYQPHRRHNGGDAIPAHPSLSASSSSSISPLDASPLSPSRRELAPPTLAPSSPLYPHSDSSDSDSDSMSPNYWEDDVPKPKERLLQRLQDLVVGLSQPIHVDDKRIDILHTKVDEFMNVLLTGASSKAKPQSPRLPPRELEDHSRGGSDLSKEPDPDYLLPSKAYCPAPPTQPSPSVKPGTGRWDHGKGESRSKMTVAKAKKVIAEADSLHRHLEVVISNLHDRQEETEHIHALLITRLEIAAQRIIDLEEILRARERELKDCDAELLNLQIQLKAIEVQCLDYVPEDADQALRAGINAWKAQWSAMQQKRAKNKERAAETPTKRQPSHRIE
ncbi:hypothetical protein F4777DRAFT_479159 [Nemania sp. FL0916]|nr:hypothetical protein F4777DRAFT_479159 [Nemania sp. FL0916]